MMNAALSDLNPLPTLPEGTRILVVEDAEEIQIVFRQLIELAGGQVTIAGHAADAIEHARENKPDLILMDMNLPDMDGPMATHRIRSEGYAGPIIAVTGASSTREAFRRAGATGYLSKPVDAGDLLGAISSSLKH